MDRVRNTTSPAMCRGGSGGSPRTMAAAIREIFAWGRSGFILGRVLGVCCFWGGGGGGAVPDFVDSVLSNLRRGEREKSAWGQRWYKRKEIGKDRRLTAPSRFCAHEFNPARACFRNLVVVNALEGLTLGGRSRLAATMPGASSWGSHALIGVGGEQKCSKYSKFRYSGFW